MTLDEILFSANNARIQRLRDQNISLVHYTSAVNALNILQDRHIWLRNALLMNDSSEMRHGFELTRTFLDGNKSERFMSVLKEINPNLPMQVAKRFEKSANGILNTTYITCFSEHSPGQLPNGMLSMWRAYGPDGGVGIVLNGDSFFREDVEYGVFLSPVEYLNEAGFAREWEKLIGQIQNNIEFLKTNNQESVEMEVYRAIVFAIISLKNSGFSEEKEWRAIYSPRLGPSDFLAQKKEFRAVGSQAEKIYRLPIEFGDCEGNPKIATSGLIKNIIIGPCRSPNETRNVFCEVLHGMGFENVEDVVQMSDIPLRV